MSRKQSKTAPKRALRLPDLDFAKSAVLNTLRSSESKRSYRFAIDDFVAWYCSEPRLSFNKTVVLRYRLELEARRLSSSTINLRLAAVRRLAYEAADTGLLSPELAAGIEGPRGADTEASIEHLRKSFEVAEGVLGELVEWARIQGQPWLGLHGQPVRRIGNHLLGDDSVDIADYGFSEDVLPQIEEEHTPEYEIEASLDCTNASSLAQHLARNGGALPIAETLLADALYFIGLNPPDWQRAVLIAAIACEVKVKDTLRRKVPPDRLSFVDLMLDNPRDWSLAAVALFDKAMNAALGRSLRAERLEVYKDITKLFEVRNRIAHRGERPNDEDARRVVLAAREVFRWLDGL